MQIPDITEPVDVGRAEIRQEDYSHQSIIVIIRDFAYPCEESRHKGYYAPVPSPPSTSSNPHISSSSGTKYHAPSEESITHSSAEQSHHFASLSSISRLPDASLPVTQLIHHVLPKLCDLLGLDLKRAVAMYDFEKAGNWEMSLTHSHDLFVVSKRIAPPPPPPPSTTTTLNAPSTGEEYRWASCDDLEDEEEKPRSKKGHGETVPSSGKHANDHIIDWTSVHIKLQPEAKQLLPHMHEYIGYEVQYGKDWVTGIKLEFGLDEGDANDTIEVHVVDIGLVPMTYITFV